MGFLAVLFEKIIFIVSTSFGGTFSIIFAIDTLAGGQLKEITIETISDFTHIDAYWATYVEFAMLVLGTIVCAVVQLKITARNYSHSAEDAKYERLDQDLFYN